MDRDVHSGCVYSEVTHYGYSYNGSFHSGHVHSGRTHYGYAHYGLPHKGHTQFGRGIVTLNLGQTRANE